MIELNESNFAEKTSQGLVLVDFYSTWCGPCKLLAPILEQITNIEIMKVNTDHNMELASQFSIASIPTLLFLRDGRIVDRSTGLVSREFIQSRVDALREEENGCSNCLETS